MIDAGKFAKWSNPTPLEGGEKHFFCFGLCNDNAADELRRFADAIEQKQILLQKVQTGSVAENGDFTLQAIMITFAERGVVEERDGKPTAYLYGEQGFPVAIERSE